MPSTALSHAAPVLLILSRRELHESYRTFGSLSLPAQCWIFFAQIDKVLTGQDLWALPILIPLKLRLALALLQEPVRKHFLFAEFVEYCTGSASGHCMHATRKTAQRHFFRQLNIIHLSWKLSLQNSWCSCPSHLVFRFFLMI